MEESEKVELTGLPVPWFEGARELLAKAEPGGEEVLDWIEAEIKANRMTLFRVRDAWETIGIFTARWERQFNGEKHLLIIHGVATKFEDGFSFMATISELVKKIARDCGCSRVEIHTRRRGVDKILTRHGYEFQESIFSVKA